MLHPWAYDLDSVDFKYIISKDQINSIIKATPNDHLFRLVWLSFFKAQTGCGSDEFVNALRELSEMMSIDGASSSRDYFNFKLLPRLEEFMLKTNFVISIKEHRELATSFIGEILN